MAIYYVRKTGSDANSGLSAALAKLTVSAVASLVAAGDFVVAGKGKYNEKLTLATNGTSGSRITWIADITGELTGDAGPVVISACDTDNLTTTRTDAVNMAGVDFNTFDGFTFNGGSNATVTMSSATDATIWRRCTFHGGISGTPIFKGLGTYFTNWIIENCTFFGSNGTFTYGGLFNSNGGALTTSGNQLYFRNNLVFLGGAGQSNGMGYNTSLNYTTITHNVFLIFSSQNINSDSNGMGTGGGTGGIFSNNVYWNFGEGQTTAPSDAISSAATKSGNVYAKPYVYPVHNELFTDVGSGTPIGIGVTTSNYAAADDAVVTRSATTGNEGRPRPSGYTHDAGPVERMDPPTRESTVVDEGTYSARISGAGVVDFRVATNSTGTVTITCRVRKNSSYSGTAAKIELSGPGLTTTSASMTVGADTWETLTISAVATSVKGVARLRVQSFSSAASSYLYFDNFTITRT